MHDSGQRGSKQEKERAEARERDAPSSDVTALPDLVECHPVKGSMQGRRVEVSKGPSSSPETFARWFHLSFPLATRARSQDFQSVDPCGRSKGACEGVGPPQPAQKTGGDPKNATGQRDESFARGGGVRFQRPLMTRPPTPPWLGEGACGRVRWGRRGGRRRRTRPPPGARTQGSLPPSPLAPPNVHPRPPARDGRRRRSPSPDRARPSAALALARPASSSSAAAASSPGADASRSRSLALARPPPPPCAQLDRNLTKTHQLSSRMTGRSVVLGGVCRPEGERARGGGC